ncbi:hypothetical protein CKO15_01835 [Halorhodospira abdelmalekii]|uniref:tetratricopeptide repeat protein n=1 Tax=Halorhodospira abdelmalekii TaxID=421629 RepID=UPI001A93A3E0|nr:tetratricopeptide repeat protein [Halorhodospira abdelmalekii]MBK1734042.1 hypothetical protein [Halorhodospira abdelmalekii]
MVMAVAVSMAMSQVRSRRRLWPRWSASGWGRLFLVPVLVGTVALLSGCALFRESPPEPKQEAAQIEPPEWQIDPRTAAIRHLLIAGVALQREQPEQALVHYSQAMRLTRDPLVVERAVQLAVLLQDDERAEAAAQRWSELAPERIEAHQLLGLLALRRGEVEQGRVHWARFVEGWPGSTGDAFVQLLRLLDHGVDEAAAFAALAEVAAEYADIAQAQWVLAQSAERAGEPQRALSAAAQALTLAESDARLYPRIALFKGSLLQRQGDVQMALELFEEALKVAPEHVDLLYGRGIARAAAGDDRGAEADFRRVLAQAPHDPHAQNALGYTLADQGRDLEEAYELISRALARRPESAAILDSKGWVLYRMGELERALEYLERAFEKEQDAEIAAHLGEVLWELGERERARAVWREAVAEDPEHQVLRETLQRYGVDPGDE